EEQGPDVPERHPAAEHPGAIGAGLNPGPDGQPTQDRADEDRDGELDANHDADDGCGDDSERDKHDSPFSSTARFSSTANIGCREAERKGKIMAEAVARAQRVADRRQQILDAARAMAEADGWTAVTSRRLADAIGYTQPVLYGHFPGGKTEIMRTVALAGCAELTSATRTAMGVKTGPQAIAAVAGAYLDFAATHPSLYQAMFELPI